LRGAPVTLRRQKCFDWTLLVVWQKQMIIICQDRSGVDRSWRPLIPPQSAANRSRRGLLRFEIGCSTENP
jgi:hypothetical protein